MPPVQTHHPRRRRALEIVVGQNAVLRVFADERGWRNLKLLPQKADFRQARVIADNRVFRHGLG